jgi:phosphatidylglycerophosphate synthase
MSDRSLSLHIVRKTGYALLFRATVVHALAGVALFALARTLRAAFEVGGLFILKALAVYAAGTLLCLLFVRERHPFARYGPANTITAIRGALIALIVGLIGEPYSVAIAWFAALLAVGITVLDGVDGRLARETGLSSEYGARFDMEADSVLVLALSALAWQYGKAGPWVLGIGLMRYLFVAAGKALPWLTGPLSPTLRGKTVAVVQMGALSFVLAPFVPPPLSMAVAAIALAMLVWSFAIDVGRLWRARGRARA